MTIEIVRRESERKIKTLKREKSDESIKAGGKRSPDLMNRNRPLFRFDRVADTTFSKSSSAPTIDLHGGGSPGTAQSRDPLVQQTPSV